jgi:hypothetical protein
VLEFSVHVAEVLDPGVPPLEDLAKMFPKKSSDSLLALNQDTLLLSLGITTTTQAPTTAATTLATTDSTAAGKDPTTPALTLLQHQLLF